MARRRSSSLASSLRPAPLFLLLLTLCLSYSACAFQLLPGRDRFHEGERIDVFVETVQGVGIGLHDLPLCQSPDLAVVPPRRFVDLVRLKPPLYRTIYDVKVLKTEVCKLLCVSPRIASQGVPSQNLLSILMHDNPQERSVALHLADRQLEGQRLSNHSSRSPGRLALGFKTADDFFLNNHISFVFEYTSVRGTLSGRPLFSISRASAHAMSTATKPGTISQCEEQSLHQRYAGDVIFTYSVRWLLKPQRQPLDAAADVDPGEAGLLQLLLVIVAAAGAAILGLSATWWLLCRSFCRLGADVGYQKLGGHRPLLGTPLWPETLAAVAGSGVLAAGLLFLVAMYEPSQEHPVTPPVLVLGLLGASCGALTSWLCALLRQPMTAYSLILVSTLPTTIVLGSLWSVELMLGDFQQHVAASAASALATSLLAICCAAFGGSLLVSRLSGTHFTESHLEVVPLHLPKALSPRLLWLLSGTWMLLAGSFSLLVVLYWPWRGVRLAVLVACSFHILATSQLAALLSLLTPLCHDDGQWLWRVFWTTFVGGLVLGAGACLILLERASLTGHPVFSGFLLPCASFTLVLGFTSAGVCVTACVCFFRMIIGTHCIVLE